MNLKLFFTFNLQKQVLRLYKLHSNGLCINNLTDRTYCYRNIVTERTVDSRTCNTTLRHKFINYFKSSEKYKPYFIAKTDSCIVQMDNFDINRIVIPTFDSVVDFVKLSDKDLLYSVNLLTSEHVKLLNLNKENYDSLLKSLDNEFCKRFDTMTVENVLKCLSVWVNILSHRITMLSFYSLFIGKMINWNTYYSCSCPEVILCLFYITYHKVTYERKAAIKLCLRKLDSVVNGADLTVLELCIISDSAFRTGTRILSDKLLAANVKVLKMHLHEIIYDPIMLVSLIKPLRHSHYIDYSLLSYVTKTLLNSDVLKKFQLMAKVHILALYAEALVNDEEFFGQIIALCLQDLKNKRLFLTESQCQTTLKSSEIKSSTYSVHKQYETRLKDISRFLWSVSYLGWTISQDDIKNFLIPELKEKFVQNEHLKSPQDLISSILSLWILGIFDQLLFSFINSKYINVLKGTGKDRLKARLLLLLTCVQIEEPSFLKREHLALFEETTPLQDAAEVDKHLKTRSKLKQVYDTVKCLSNHLNLSSISCCFTIPHLHILGIEVHTFTGMTVNIELLDSTVCLHNSEIPHGLMKLKLRLLNSKGHNLLIIREKQLDELETSSDLFSYLEDELKKVTHT